MRGRVIPPFAWVTSAAGAVIAASGLIDALTSTGDAFGSVWTLAWVALTVLLAGLPLLFGARLALGIGVAGAAVFFTVTSLQMALSTSAVASVNNLVLYPMLACYLGWFYRRTIARIVTGAGFTLSGIAVLINTHDMVFLTWINLALASVFCLEAAGYLRAKLDREITTDPLTRVLNRTGLDQRIATELARAARTGEPLTIAIIDLDDFKRINDHHGHAAGDRLLVEFATTLTTQSRPFDSVVRIGGDEFLLVLPALTQTQALVFLEQVRVHTPQHWSFGIATATPGDTSHTIRDRADHALYAQKQNRKQS